MATDKLRAATYTRISRDDEEEDGNGSKVKSRLGVERQAEDLRREAKRRGATVVLPPARRGAHAIEKSTRAD